jgi:hypothetical protein
VPSDLAGQARLSDDYRRGLLVSDVATAGPGFRKLFEGRDIIVQILNPAPRRVVRSTSDLDQALDKMRDGDVISLLVYSLDAQQTRVVNLRIGS